MNNVSNMNCEFFITHDNVERQVGLNDVLHYLTFSKVDKKFKKMLKDRTPSDTITIDEFTFCTLEPVELRTWI